MRPRSAAGIRTVTGVATRICHSAGRHRLAGRAAHLDSQVERLIDGVHATDLRKNQVAGLPRKRELRAADS
jgi:hypothetical protein